ncbi:hypothetical protein [Mucilaginibacter sp. 3215]|uniref:hypothetical protein n=1 Tax=Mucilaginibacter sp. 3215 TaxID=3373912 RepID=UPI003D1DA6F3
MIDELSDVNILVTFVLAVMAHNEHDKIYYKTLFVINLNKYKFAPVPGIWYTLAPDQ